ncbi:MAG: acyltransferase domain-containing protein [Salinisphaera sp.]|uniref:ACP S-malonyltransferase n=1 Tax=Salinisphaera sp. TaxID=1914330 RepID=UPI003C79774F
MSVVFTFPGQGAQRPGMIADLSASEVVADTLAEASEVVGEDIHALDRRAALADTRAVQIALCVVGVAAARDLIAAGATPDAVLGLSIGAWPAAVIAEAIDFPDAVWLVAERGRLMGAAYPDGYGMAAVIGLGESAVRSLLDKLNARAEPGHALYLANVNADQQIVVAGSDPALADLERAAATAGAQRVVRLDMAVPSHCALMDEPARELGRIARDTVFHKPKLAYFSANRRRRLWTGADIRDDLVMNMARTVHWADTARIVDESGFRLAVEMPPGRTLTRLHPPVEPPGEAIALADTGAANTQALVARARAGGQAV